MRRILFSLLWILGVFFLTPDSAHTDNPVVQLFLGPVQGTIQYAANDSTPVFTFLGIPYALPPVDERRFRPPKPIKPWDSILQATEFGSPCLQPYALTQRSFSPLSLSQSEDEMSEDCLYLNIYTPSISHHVRLPVFVWVHSGDFSTGMGSMFDGTAYAARENIVVVTFNYRLGVFGFLSMRDGSCPGNYGLLDQLEVLSWVQSHIARFGGDPKRVTLGGHRAGAVSVSLHLVSPLSKGLFRAAIAQSGTSLTSLIHKDNHREMAVLFTELVARCSKTPSLSSRDMVECLRHIPADDLLHVQSHMQHKIQLFLPAIDGYFLRNTPYELYAKGNVQSIPYLTGLTSHAGFFLAKLRNRDFLTQNFRHRSALSSVKDWIQYFDYRLEDVMEEAKAAYMRDASDDDVESLKVAYSSLVGDVWMLAPLHLSATLHSVLAPVFMYLVQYKPSYSLSPEFINGATHLEDLTLVWGCPLSPAHAPCSSLSFSSTDESTSLSLMTHWAQFIRKGDPNVEGFSRWPVFDVSEQAYLAFDSGHTLKGSLNSERALLWNKKHQNLIDSAVNHHKDSNRAGSNNDSDFIHSDGFMNWSASLKHDEL